MLKLRMDIMKINLSTWKNEKQHKHNKERDQDYKLVKIVMAK